MPSKEKRSDPDSPTFNSGYRIPDYFFTGNYRLPAGEPDVEREFAAEIVAQLGRDDDAELYMALYDELARAKAVFDHIHANNQPVAAYMEVTDFFRARIDQILYPQDLQE